MIHQTDAKFPDDIRHYGCYMLALLYQIEEKLKTPLMTYNRVKEIFATEQAKGNIGAECFLTDPQRLVDDLVPGKLTFKGKVAADYKTSIWEFEIQCWYNPKTDFHHFVAGGDPAACPKGVAYDPIEGGSRTVREGYLESKRIFDIVDPA